MTIKPHSVRDAFDLRGRVAVVTGGAGLLGLQHANAIAEAGGTPVLLDLRSAADAAKTIADAHGCACESIETDITNENELAAVRDRLLSTYGRIDILINNAANNPAVTENTEKDAKEFSRLENFDLNNWNADIQVGLTGAFLCSRVFGAEMARAGKGAILNIASDLGLIAPNQSLYRIDGRADADQPVKPVTYSVVKAGLIGLTRYLATYWATSGVRANALAPGGVEAGQPAEFLDRLHPLIPLGRMAKADEYKAAVVFLVSDASSYMTGSVISVDGGRTCW